MPRFWMFSDLHQDWPDNFWDLAAFTPPAGFDAVLAAGDVASPMTAALDWLHSRFPGVRVVYTPGNHDFWCDPKCDDRFTLQDQIARGRDRAARYGIDLLIDDTIVIDGVRVIGATLWTDLRLSLFDFSHSARQAEKRMRDYRHIRRRRSGPKKYVRAGDLLALHRASVAYINDALSKPHDGATLVMTHHAPSALSLDDDARAMPWCYASALDDLILHGKPDVWVHGHIHARLDYFTGGTRVVCNALGHIEQLLARASFDPSLVIDIP